MLDAALSYLTQPLYYQLHCVGKMKELVYLCLANLPHKVLTEDVCQQRGSQKQRLQRLLHFVEENYMHKIRLGDFAQQEGMAVSSLSHFFKKLTHQELPAVCEHSPVPRRLQTAAPPGRTNCS